MAEPCAAGQSSGIRHVHEEEICSTERVLANKPRDAGASLAHRHIKFRRPASPRNRPGRAEALAACTAGGARLTGEQDVKGILSPGYYADFAVLSEDYFAIQENRIPEIGALLTVAGGWVVYAAGFFGGLARPRPRCGRTGSRPRASGFGPCFS